MRRYLWKAVLLALVPALSLGACGTGQSSRFYTLVPVTSVRDTSLAGPPLYIGIMPVEIPDYLDRPQIVTRDANDELKIAEFDRWAGELQNDVARVLAETLTSGFPGHRVFILTGRRAIPADYRITVQVTRFDPTPGKNVWLKAEWAVLGKDGRQVVVRGESSLVEPLADGSYSATVTAMSRAVDRLGREIADAMRPRLAYGAAGTSGAQLP